MRAMRSSNPAMTAKIFEKAGTTPAGSSTMTINGTINSTGLMLLLVRRQKLAEILRFVKKQQTN
ncbi:MAG: hypothetical protein KAS82_04795 [Bacteroidales bacterium]|nr:hypothetical protein [Bacteroidales bacterium]